jgi:hypothetical protein
MHYGESPASGEVDLHVPSRKKKERLLVRVINQ